MDIVKMDLRKYKGILFLMILTILSVVKITFGYSNNYVIFSLFTVYITMIFFSEKRFFLSYGYIIFYIITNIVGVFLIETSHIYLSELDTTSANHESLLLLVIAHILFIETLRILYNSEKQTFLCQSESIVKLFNFKITKAKLLQYILLVIFVVFLVLFLLVIDKPFFKVKLDRFLYKEKYLPPIIDKISNLSLYFSVFIGMYLLHKKDKKVIPLIILIFLYLFWIGHKFSSFIVIAFIMVLPFIYYVSRERLNKIVTGGIILLLLLMSIVSIQSYVVYNRNFSENLQYIKARLAQQGQLWWATYGIEESHKLHFNELDDEFKTYFRLSIDEEDLYNSGIYKIMRLTTPEDIFYQKIYEKKSRYAYSTQATIFYYFNALGLLIFSVLSGILYYFINKNLIKNIANFNIIPALLYTRLFVILNRALLQSDFNKLFSIEVIFIIIIIIVFAQIKRRDFHIIKI
jgi:Family of unknown function (DUF6418)